MLITIYQCFTCTIIIWLYAAMRLCMYGCVSMHALHTCVEKKEEMARKLGSTIQNISHTPFITFIMDSYIQFSITQKLALIIKGLKTLR